MGHVVSMVMVKTPAWMGDAKVRYLDLLYKKKHLKCDDDVSCTLRHIPSKHRQTICSFGFGRLLQLRPGNPTWQRNPQQKFGLVIPDRSWTMNIR